MNYKQVLKELYSLDVPKWKLGLERIELLLKKIGNPEKNLRCLHVAGTNGKGSVCAMLHSILIDAGYKAGMYTSPHLKKFNERIRINNVLITDGEIVKYYLKVKKRATNQSFFEITTAMAFLYFKEKNIDFLVLEVGLGGRLDATNVVTPLVSIITNIGLEHTNILGKTLEKIAYEKAGIIKENAQVITAAEGIALDTIKKIADKKNSELIIVDKNKIKRNLTLKHLNGKFQACNAAIAVKSIEIIKNCYKIKINKRNIINGLKNAEWPGRLQFLEKNVLVDCAHNPDGFKALINELKYIPHKNLILMLGFSDDKDIKSISKMVNPLASQIILTKSDSKRAAEPESIKRYFNKSTITVQNPKKALDCAKKIAKKGDLILIAGSIFLVGEIM